MRRHVACVILFGSVFLAGCSKDLTRSKAAEIISRRFPRPVTLNMPVGQTGTMYSTMEAYLKSNDGRIRKLDQDDGVLSLSWVGPVRTPLGPMIPIVRVDVTEKGKTYVTGTLNNGAFLSIKMCEAVFDRITGIVRITDNTAKVDFTWKIANLTPFGTNQKKVLGNEPWPCPEPGGGAESTILTRYDDGWRQ